MGGPSWLRLPFARRLLTAMLVIAIPLLVMAVLFFVFWIVQRRQQVVDTNLQQARLGAAFVQGWVERHQGVLHAIAVSNEVSSGSVAVMEAMIARQLRLHPSWVTLAITDARGIIVASNIDTARGLSLEDQPFFQALHRIRKATVSNLRVSQQIGGEVVSVAAPILRDGQFAGGVVANIRPQQLERIFDSIQATQASVIELWGSDEQLIAHSGTIHQRTGGLAGENVRRIFTGRAGSTTVRSAATGERFLIAYDPVAGTPWVLVVGLAYRQAIAPIYVAMLIFAAITIFLLLLGLWWSLRITRNITQDLDEMATATREIGGGNLAARVELPPRSELASIGGSINRMAEQLQISERLKFDLIRLITHELRTPLTAILTAQELVPRTEENREMLEIISHQAERLRELIENLISVARAQAGTLVVHPVPTPLHSVVERMVEHMRRRHGAERIPINIDIPEDLRVMADPPLLSLVLHNLLDNAVKFTQQGQIGIRAHPEDGHATVTVTDTGIGFGSEVQRQLFELFTHPEALLTRSYGGVGIGLAVVRAIVEAQGGNVFAESPGPGQGSTFGFVLPLAPAEETSPETS
ncbi:MAG: sensor histidine kinase [Armatimonadota bacterium]